MLGLPLLLYRATDWHRDRHRRQCGTDLALPGLVPGGPAARMQLGDPCQQDSIAIGCRLCDRLRADIFSGAAPVLDHDLLSPHFGQPVRLAAGRASPPKPISCSWSLFALLLPCFLPSFLSSLISRRTPVRLWTAHHDATETRAGLLVLSGRFCPRSRSSRPCAGRPGSGTWHSG